jgi:hypothetical protein
MAERRRGARGMSPHRRVPFLIGAAAVGAIGVSVLAPSAQADDGSGHIANRQAALILAEASTPEASAQDTNGSTDSAQALSATVVARARSRTLAATHSPARPPAAARQFPATQDGFRAYALGQVGAAQFGCLNPLWERESHWRPDARNPASTAYGIPQLLDGTWRYTGVAKTSDGFRQVDAGIAYLRRAYPGGPCGAWAHEQAVGWY